MPILILPPEVFRQTGTANTRRPQSDAFPEDISAQARIRLEGLGVRVLSEARVLKADAQGFHLSDGHIVSAALKVWAAGVKAPDFLAKLDGLETGSDNRLFVRPSLQTTSDPAVYAVGDCASLHLQGAERALPPTAQVASQQARHLANYLPQSIKKGVAIPDFKYQDFGALVSLGDYDAYGSFEKLGFFSVLTLKGRIAHLSHSLLYRRHQVRIHGAWRGSLLWFVDQLNKGIKARIRLD